MLFNVYDANNQFIVQVEANNEVEAEEIARAILQTSEYNTVFGFTPSAWQGILAIIGLVVVLPLVEGFLEGVIEKKEKT